MIEVSSPDLQLDPGILDTIKMGVEDLCIQNDPRMIEANSPDPQPDRDVLDTAKTRLVVDIQVYKTLMMTKTREDSLPLVRGVLSQGDQGIRSGRDSQEDRGNQSRSKRMKQHLQMKMYKRRSGSSLAKSK